MCIFKCLGQIPYQDVRGDVSVAFLVVDTECLLQLFSHLKKRYEIHQMSFLTNLYLFLVLLYHEFCRHGAECGEVELALPSALQTDLKQGLVKLLLLR